jgi:hypothetical protein
MRRRWYEEYGPGSGSDWLKVKGQVTSASASGSISIIQDLNPVSTQPFFNPESVN